ncbi:hNH endonuclease [Escherichia coli]|uniref:hNH endonuclease n=1 Tax=Escherichia coli TaxID=562 RepID=UPI000DA4D159|nr:hNH endonuclease [Escherichia coli]EFE7939724.1 hNH endonuclease [Escherichia coli]EFG4207534.1 hNH endonuclease [Escherichia coli]EFH8873845.1 hNH endonuclease [Escherichia coli]ELH3081581.1 hNH endonuclease [Escherichia coli]MDA6766640.1 hNH endonuclease [Escherichia coli]
MKQMSLIEMNGFLKGKCIPRDLNVNETNAEYLVRKFGELESKLETALRECLSAGITIDNLEAKCTALAAENAGMKSVIEYCINPDNQPEYHDQGMGCGVEDHGYQRDGYSACYYGWESAMERVYSEVIPDAIPETPTTDAFLAEVRAQGVEMYADNLDNGADDAERGGFDYAVKFLRSEASSVRLFADQLRKGGDQ